MNRTADRNNKKVLCAICRKGFPNDFTSVALLDSMSISSKSNKNTGKNHASNFEELKKIQAKALRDIQKIQDETKPVETFCFRLRARQQICFNTNITCTYTQSYLVNLNSTNSF